MIERQNIIKLLSGRANPNAYHSAILTCYNFDPIFFESVYLPTLRSLGITNVIVVMDASMYDNLLADPSYICHKISQNNYSLVRYENKFHGVFHPKMLLIFGEEEGAFIVGSGNLTFSGLSNNEEVWNVFHVAGNNSVHYPLLYKAWAYIQNILSDDSLFIQKQLGWITEQSVWMLEPSNQDVVMLNNRESCSVLYNTQNVRIIDEVAKSIDNAIVKKITVIAPFYDTDGNALKELHNRFHPAKMNCILDLKKQSAPYALLNATDYSNITFYKYIGNNPLHAKIFEFQTNNGTWILTGSANAGNMALGINAMNFNNEACVLLHNMQAKNYIKDLGLQFEELCEEERNAIVRPEQARVETSNILTTIRSSEETEGNIILKFSVAGIEGIATILDSEQRVVFEQSVVSSECVAVVVDETKLQQCHMVVLKSEGVCISNHCLILREIHVESCNPDPRRRILSRFLDDTHLIDNLSDILGYIKFDEESIEQKYHKKSDGVSSSHNKDDIIVMRNRFNSYKDSTLSITLHSGIRILSYLQKMLFKKEDIERTDDVLLEIDKAENNYQKSDTVYDCKTTDTQCLMSDTNRMRGDIVRFLKNMSSYLLNMTKDTSNHGTKVNSSFLKPELVAVPGLNASSAMAVAAKSVIVMMNKYGSNVLNRSEVRSLLIACASLSFSLFSNKLPTDNSKKSSKIRELLENATIDLLAAMSFFDSGKDDVDLPLIVMNYLYLWDDSERRTFIMSEYDRLLSQLEQGNLNQRTIERIKKVSEVCFTDDLPMQEYNSSDNVVYQYRKGHGFLLVDDVKKINDKWVYSCRSSWFNVTGISSTATKYIGYPFF